MDVPGEINPAAGGDTAGRRTKDSTRLFLATILAGLVCFPGTVMCLIGMHKYDVLDFNKLLTLIAATLAVFAALWAWLILAATKDLGFRKDARTLIFIMIVPGAAVGSMATCLGLIFWINGYGDHTVIIRDIGWESKRASRGDNPSYYARIVSPAEPGRTIDLQIGEEKYLALNNERLIRLTTGEGRLHIEWIRKIELADKPVRRTTDH